MAHLVAELPRLLAILGVPSLHVFLEIIISLKSQTNHSNDPQV